MSVFGGEALEFATGLDLSGLDGGLKKGVRMANAAGASMGSAFAIAAKGLLAAGTAVAGFGGLALQAGAEFEGLETRLTTLLGSAEMAANRMDDIAAMAASTPFELAELVEAEVNLRALGVAAEDVLPLVVDFAGAMGTDVVSASVEVGRAMQFGAGAVESIAGRALRAQVELRTGSDALKMSTAEFREELTKTLTDPDGIFAGGSAKLAATFSGLMSTLGDEWNGFVRQTADAGFFDGAKAALRETLEIIGENRTEISALADEVGTGLTAALMLGVQAVGGMVDGWTLVKLGAMSAVATYQLGHQLLLQMKATVLEYGSAAAKAFGAEDIFIGPLLETREQIMNVQDSIIETGGEISGLWDSLGSGLTFSKRMNNAILAGRDSGRQLNTEMGAVGVSAAGAAGDAKEMAEALKEAEKIAKAGADGLTAFYGVLEGARAQNRGALQQLAQDELDAYEELAEATRQRLEGTNGDLAQQELIVMQHLDAAWDLQWNFEVARTRLEAEEAKKRADIAQKEVDRKAAIYEEHFSGALNLFGDFVGARIAAEESLGQSILKLAAGVAAQELLILAARLTAEGAALVATVGGIPAGLLKFAGAAAATAGAAAIQAGATAISSGASLGSTTGVSASDAESVTSTTTTTTTEEEEAEVDSDPVVVALDQVKKEVVKVRRAVYLSAAAAQFGIFGAGANLLAGRRAR